MMRQIRLLCMVFFLTLILLYLSLSVYGLTRLVQNLRAMDAFHMHLFSICFCVLGVVISLYSFLFVARYFHADDMAKRNQVSLVAGFTTILYSSSLVWLQFPHSVFIAVIPILSLTSLAVLYGRAVAAILLEAIAGVVFSGILFSQNHTALAVGVLILAIMIILAKTILEKIITDWDTEHKMADQALWAATEYAKANLRLQESVRRTEIASKIAERAHIGQEIHDTVGHALTAILMHLRAAQQISKIDSSNIATVFSELSKIVEDAIQEVRREVYHLRDDQPLKLSWQLKWRQLCINFSECTGAKIDLLVPDELGEVNATLGEAVFRTIQEALTNSIRHGRAMLIDITMKVKVEEKRLLIRISDDGRGAKIIKMGLGLRGITEKIASLGGRVAWRTLPHRGFDIGVELPWEQVANEEDTTAYCG